MHHANCPWSVRDGGTRRHKNNDIILNMHCICSPKGKEKSLSTSQLTLPRSTALPSIASLEFRPRADRTGLYAQITLPAVLGFKVAHALDLVLPAVPHRHVRQGLARDEEAVCTALGDYQGHQGAVVLAAWRGVDPVGLRGEGKGRRGFGKGLGVADFVDVWGLVESFHGGFVDVLREEMGK